MLKVSTESLLSHLDSFSNELSQLLDADSVAAALDELDYSFRSRVFTPFVTLHAALSQALSENSSCLSVVSELAVGRRIKGLGDICLNSGSYCKAKARLPLELFKRLTARFGACLDGPEDEEFGRVFIVDGTGVSMSDTKKNRSKYQKHGGNDKGKGFPAARMLALFSLSTGGLIDFTLGPLQGKGTGELSLLNELWKNLRAGDTLLADALYSNFHVFAKALQLGVNVVCEFPAKKCAKRISRRKNIQIITVEKPRKPATVTQEVYDAWPSEIQIRIIKIRCAPAGYRPKVKFIATTDEDSISEDRVIGIYRQRWQVEVNLRSIKETMGMDFLKSRSPEMFEKEVWTFALAYNLIRSHMLQTGAKTKKLPDHLSFKACMTILKLTRLAGMFGLEPGEQIFDLVLSSPAIGMRPNRYEPRAIKMRKKNFAFLSEERKAAKSKLHKKIKF